MRPSGILLACLVVGTSWTFLQTVDRGGNLTSRYEAYTIGGIPFGLPEARTPQTGNRETAPILFDWSATPDQIIPWLKKNERLLDHGDGCSLMVSWASAKPEERSLPSASNHEIASLIVTPEDEEIHTIFRDKVSGSGLDVRVGVQYIPSLKSGLSEIRIALALDGPVQDVFNEVSRAEGATLRNQEWKRLTIVKPIKVSEMNYRYSLTCENGKTFLSFLRRPTRTHTPAATKPQ
jgi:hypothetical protein